MQAIMLLSSPANTDLDYQSFLNVNPSIDKDMDKKSDTNNVAIQMVYRKLYWRYYRFNGSRKLYILR